MKLKIKSDPSQILIAQAIALAERWHGISFELAGVLWHLNEHKTKPDGMELYCWVEKVLDIKQRKAQYWVSFYGEHVRLGYSVDETNNLIHELGWCKVNYLYPKMPEKKCPGELISKFKKMTLSAMRGKAKGTGEHTIGFNLDNKYVKKWEAVMEHFGMDYKANGRRRGVGLAVERLLDAIEV